MIGMAQNSNIFSYKNYHNLIDSSGNNKCSPISVYSVDHILLDEDIVINEYTAKITKVVKAYYIKGKYKSGVIIIRYPGIKVYFLPDTNKYYKQGLRVVITNKTLPYKECTDLIKRVINFRN